MEKNASNSNSKRKIGTGKSQHDEAHTSERTDTKNVWAHNYETSEREIDGKHDEISAGDEDRPQATRAHFCAEKHDDNEPEIQSRNDYKSV